MRIEPHWQNQPEPEALNREGAKNHVQCHNMAGFRAPKLDTVRVGVIGLGNRGPNHLKALVQIDHVEIRALCDKNPEQIERGLAWAHGAGHTPEIYTDGEAEWKKLCEQKDLDLIDCLRHGLPLPQDVYDAVAWSSLVPLTQWSSTHQSQAMDVPDFTAGAWEANPRNMDIDLTNGGGDTRILPPSKAAMAFDDELARQWARDHREGNR